MTNSTTTEVATSSLPAAGTYNVDAVHSTVGFVARHLVASKVRGRFTDFTGVITIGRHARDLERRSDGPGRQHHDGQRDA